MSVTHRWENRTLAALPLYRRLSSGIPDTRLFTYSVMVFIPVRLMAQCLSLIHI